MGRRKGRGVSDREDVRRREKQNYAKTVEEKCRMGTGERWRRDKNAGQGKGGVDGREVGRRKKGKKRGKKKHKPKKEKSESRIS